MQSESWMDSLGPWALVGVGALALVTVWVLWRRSRRGPNANPARSSDGVFEALRIQLPQFQSIFGDLGAEACRSLLEHGEAGPALQKLDELLTLPPSAGTSLNLSTLASRSKDIDAAAVTILRTVYSDPELSRRLSPESLEATDALLDQILE